MGPGRALRIRYWLGFLLRRALRHSIHDCGAQRPLRAFRLFGPLLEQPLNRCFHDLVPVLARRLALSGSLPIRDRGANSIPIIFDHQANLLRLGLVPGQRGLLQAMNPLRADLELVSTRLGVSYVGQYEVILNLQRHDLVHVQAFTCNELQTRRRDVQQKTFQLSLRAVDQSQFRRGVDLEAWFPSAVHTHRNRQLPAIPLGPPCAPY